MNLNKFNISFKFLPNSSLTIFPLFRLQIPPWGAKWLTFEKHWSKGLISLTAKNANCFDCNTSNFRNISIDLE